MTPARDQRSTRKASISTISCWSSTDASARRRLLRAARRGARIRRAIRSRTSTTSRRRSPPTRRACGAPSAWSTTFGLPTVEAYMGHVQDNAAESVRRVIDRLSDSEFPIEIDQGAIIKVKISVDKQGARRRSISPERRAQQRDELQRAGAGHARRGALCLPRDGRRRHPDERRLSAADQDRHPRRLDAVAALSRRRRRRQCRDSARR